MLNKDYIAKKLLRCKSRIKCSAKYLSIVFGAISFNINLLKDKQLLNVRNANCYKKDFMDKILDMFGNNNSRHQFFFKE